MAHQFKSFSYFHLNNIPPATSLNTDFASLVNNFCQLPVCPFGRKDAISSFLFACHSSSGLDAISALIDLSKDLLTRFTPRNFHSLVISGNGLLSRSS